MPTGGGGGKGGEGDGGGGGDGGEGFGQVLSAVREATLTPAAMMPPACAEMQAKSTALLVDGTPAITNGVASAVKHVVQALATSEHGATAAVKLCAAVTGHVTGDGGGGGDGVCIGAGAVALQHTEPLRLFTPVFAFIQQPLFDSPKPLQPTHASHCAAHASYVP